MHTYIHTSIHTYIHTCRHATCVGSQEHGLASKTRDTHMLDNGAWGTPLPMSSMPTNTKTRATPLLIRMLKRNCTKPCIKGAQLLAFCTAAHSSAPKQNKHSYMQSLPPVVWKK